MDLNKLFERPASGDTRLLAGDMSGERPIIRYGLMAFGFAFFGMMVLNSGNSTDNTPTAQTVASGPPTCQQLKAEADHAEGWAGSLRAALNLPQASMTTRLQFEDTVQEAEAKAIAAIGAWSRQCAR